MVKYIVDSPDNVARLLLSYFTMSMVSATAASGSHLEVTLYSVDLQ
jgi:hypothetical protein